MSMNEQEIDRLLCVVTRALRENQESEEKFYKAFSVSALVAFSSLLGVLCLGNFKFLRRVMTPEDANAVWFVVGFSLFYYVLYNNIGVK